MAKCCVMPLYSGCVSNISKPAINVNTCMDMLKGQNAFLFTVTSGYFLLSLKE